MLQVSVTVGSGELSLTKAELSQPTGLYSCAGSEAICKHPGHTTEELPRIVPYP